MSPKRTKHAGGRPPAGVRPGEKVSDYAHFTIRLPQDVRSLLHAVGEVTRLPGWRVLHDALHAYVQGLSSADRQLVMTLAAHRQQTRSDNIIWHATTARAARSHAKRSRR
jgi:hypothetical protein